MLRAAAASLIMLSSGVCLAGDGQECEGLGMAVSNAFLSSMGKLMEVMFSQDEELSDAETMRLTLAYFEENFAGKGFDSYTPEVKQGFSEVGETLTLAVVAAHTQLSCERDSVPTIKSLERPLAWCNSASSRAGVSDAPSQFKVTYRCVEEVLEKGE